MNKTANKIISALCVFFIAVTILSSFTAMASTAAGTTSIKPLNANTTIDDVTKDAVVNYSSIFLKRTGDKNYKMRVWVKNTTKSNTLSDKHEFTVTSKSTGHWIKYRSVVTYSVGDNVRFYGEQSGIKSKGLQYVVFGDKAALSL